MRIYLRKKKKKNQYSGKVTVLSGSIGAGLFHLDYVLTTYSGYIDDTAIDAA